MMRWTGILTMLLLPVLFSWPGGKAETSLTDTFEAGGIDRLIVEEAAIFDLQISGYSGSSAVVEVYASDESQKVEHTTRGASGNRALVISYNPEVKIRSLGARTPRMVIKVPSRARLDVETTTGDITVEAVTGRKRLETTTGKIRVRSAQGEILARSTTGDQRFDYVEGDIRATSTTGSIHLSNVEGRVDTTSTTGSQTGRDVTLTGDSSFETSTGRIEMSFTNSMDDLAFELRSSTGRIELGENEVRGELAVGDGSILVRGRSTTGRQVYQ